MGMAVAYCGEDRVDVVERWQIAHADRLARLELEPHEVLTDRGDAVAPLAWVYVGEIDAAYAVWSASCAINVTVRKIPPGVIVWTGSRTVSTSPAATAPANSNHVETRTTTA